MTKQLTKEQVDAYHRDGVVYPVSVMSSEEARKFRFALEKFEYAHPEYLDSGRRQKLHLVQTWMADVVRWPEILDAVEDILGPDILCWQTSLFIKEAGDPGFVSWHQDGNYWGLSSQEVVTAWLALSPSRVESGCMKMMPGSHLWDSIEHEDTFDKDNLLTRGQVLKHYIDEDQAIDIVVEPGQISVSYTHLTLPTKA